VNCLPIREQVPIGRRIFHNKNPIANVVLFAYLFRNSTLISGDASDPKEVVPVMTGAAKMSSLFCRTKESIRNCSGEIVSGISDGVVVIFGLVAGMVAGARSGDVILLAGAITAVAAIAGALVGLMLS